MKYILLAFLLFSSLSFAGCPELYPNGKVLDIKGTSELCNSFYVVRYNEQNHSAILSSEVLLAKGHGIERSNNFHPDFRVKYPIKSSDYLKTGFDRGHLTPAADSTTFVGMAETFLMSNMTPQSPTLNRGEWKLLEERVRTESIKSGSSIWVVTGAVYGDTKAMRSLVPIPTYYYKIVYTNPVRVFAALNKDDAKVYETSLEELKKVVDIDF
jgi:endonuclease G